MVKPYRNLGARPVSFSLTAQDIEDLDRKRGHKSRSQWVQGQISSTEALFTTMSTKAIILALALRKDLPSQLTKDFLESVGWGME